MCLGAVHPTTTGPGPTSGHWRYNRAKYFFCFCCWQVEAKSGSSSNIKVKSVISQSWVFGLGTSICFCRITQDASIASSLWANQQVAKPLGWFGPCWTQCCGWWAGGCFSSFPGVSSIQYCHYIGSCRYFMGICCLVLPTIKSLQSLD